MSLLDGCHPRMGSTMGDGAGIQDVDTLATCMHDVLETTVTGKPCSFQICGSSNRLEHLMDADEHVIEYCPRFWKAPQVHNTTPPMQSARNTIFSQHFSESSLLSTTLNVHDSITAAALEDFPA